MSSTVSTSHGIDEPLRLGSFESPQQNPSSVAAGELYARDGEESELLYVSWNQDYGCFTAGTSAGFRIYTCDPVKETLKRDLKSGGFGIVEMLFRTNILALVGGGANSQYPPNKVMLWDDHQGRCIGEFAYRSNVRGAKLRQHQLAVVIEHRIYVYKLSNLTLLHQIETLYNPRGLCCLSHNSDSFVLACPGVRRGQVRVEHFGLKVTKMITAHDNDLACLTLTLDGLILATASVKGTLIRIFNTMDGTRLQEVRRGVERADIYSIALSPSVQWLVVSSDKGTVHVFSLRVRVGEDASDATSDQSPRMVHQNSSSSLDALVSPITVANPSSSLSFMKNVLPKYFSSEWSFAQIHLPEVTRYIAGFRGQNTVVVLGMDGSFYRYKFDPVKGGLMEQQEYVRFLQMQSHQQPRPPIA